MKYAFYLVAFMVAQTLLVGSVAALVAKHTIDQYDHGTKPETIVVRELPEPKAEPKPEANLGKMAFDNEYPLVPAGWKVGRVERIGAAVCTSVTGPGREEVIVVEFDLGSKVDPQAEVFRMMEQGGWQKSTTDYMAMWKGGRTADVSLMPNRNKATYVVGTGNGVYSARESTKQFVAK